MGDFPSVPRVFRFHCAKYNYSQFPVQKIFSLGILSFPPILTKVMASVVRSTSQSSSPITKGPDGRSLTRNSSTKVPKLKVPDPVKSKEDIHSSRSHLPLYPTSNSSATTVVDNLHDVEMPDGPPQGPPQGLPQALPDQAPEGGPAPPAYDTTVKILGGWQLGIVVAV
jgi:hypothetical protein